MSDQSTENLLQRVNSLRDTFRLVITYNLFEKCNFGLRNTAQTFQRVVDKILHNWEQFERAYMGDIQIFLVTEKIAR